jgi:hypothetical protein
MKKSFLILYAITAVSTVFLLNSCSENVDEKRRFVVHDAAEWTNAQTRIYCDKVNQLSSTTVQCITDQDTFIVQSDKALRITNNPDFQP